MLTNCSCSPSSEENIKIFDTQIDSNQCGCGFNITHTFPQNWMYGHSYVPAQRLTKNYTPEIGLKMGTIFPELVSPYCPNQSVEEITFLKSSSVNFGGACDNE